MASVAKFFASLIFLPLGNLGRMVVKGLSSMRQLVPHLMIVLFLPVALTVSPKKASAQQFQETCSFVQAYANRQNWRNKTQFSGFENSPIFDFGDRFMCESGYVSELLPARTRVCLADLVYDLRTKGVTWIPQSDQLGQCP